MINNNGILSAVNQADVKRGVYITPESVHTFADEAFKDCENLAELILPKLLVRVGKDIFANCPNLRLIKSSNEQLGIYKLVPKDVVGNNGKVSYLLFGFGETLEEIDLIDLPQYIAKIASREGMFRDVRPKLGAVEKTTTVHNLQDYLKDSNMS